MTTLSITDRFRVALQPQNRLATCLGSIVGGAVPGAVYWITHAELDPNAPLYAQAKFYLVLGGLLFSALSVYGIARDVFQSTAKAFGFVVLVEGSMTLVREPAVSLAMLAILVVINAISASVSLATQQKETRAVTRKGASGTGKGASGDVLSIAPKAAPRASRKPRTSLVRAAGGKG